MRGGGGASAAARGRGGVGGEAGRGGGAGGGCTCSGDAGRRAAEVRGLQAHSPAGETGVSPAAPLGLAMVRRVETDGPSARGSSRHHGSRGGHTSTDFRVPGDRARGGMRAHCPGRSVESGRPTAVGVAGVVLVGG